MKTLNLKPGTIFNRKPWSPVGKKTVTCQVRWDSENLIGTAFIPPRFPHNPLPLSTPSTNSRTRIPYPLLPKVRRKSTCDMASDIALQKSSRLWRGIPRVVDTYVEQHSSS